MTTERRLLVAGVAVFAILALPPVVQALQARMQLQLLVQIPLLVACGYLMRGALPERARRAIAAWNPVGINGLIVATFVLAFWMLPRSMDAAVNDWRWAALKLVSVPLLAGLPLGLSWSRMNFVVRGVVCMELIAMCVRLGLLYLASPARLCNNYLIDDQQLTGRYLLIAGIAVFAWITLRLLFGHIQVPADATAPRGEQTPGVRQASPKA